MPLFTPIVDVKHKVYCGPIAIAALTGVPVSRIEKMLRYKRSAFYRDAKGRRLPIKSTHNKQVLDVLRRLGCKVSKPIEPKMTFAAFCNDTVHVKTAYLVQVTGHWMVTCQGLYCDTGSGGIQPWATHRTPTRRVVRVWKVEAPETPRYSLGNPVERERAPKLKVDIKQARAARLVERIKAWESKERRARNALKKLKPRLAYYRKLGVEI